MDIHVIIEHYLCLTNNHKDLYMVSSEVVFALIEWLHNSKEAADEPKTRKRFQEKLQTASTLHFTKVGICQ